MRLRRHEHKWETIGVSYMPPITTLSRIQNLTDSKLAGEILFGVSTVTQRCATCGMVRGVSFEGKAAGFGGDTPT